MRPSATNVPPDRRTAEANGAAQLFTAAKVMHDAKGPMLALTGAARAVADRQGVEQWHVSLSHDAGVAVAFVVAVGQAPSRTASRPPNVDT